MSERDESVPGTQEVSVLSADMTEPPDTWPPSESRARFTLDRRGPLLGGFAGWAGPLAATALGAALRLPRLDQPHALVFDETYYVKDALSILKYGYERKVVDSANDMLLAGNPNIFTEDASYVVHPPLGKWVIAAGEHIFGANPFGWRIGVAILGILSVLIVGRITRRLTRSNVAGTTAALLLALDGLHIAMSRTALLDTTLSFFILCAFGFLIIDRDSGLTRAPHSHIPRFSRIGMTCSLGLAMATKWSAAYFAVAFVLLMLSWDFGRRRAQRIADSTGGSAFGTWFSRDALPALLIPLTIVSVYIISWFGWLRSTDAWNRSWASKTTSGNAAWDAVRSLWHYHADMWHFHTHLVSAHNYKANPLGWPLMLRPTSFFYETPDTCGVSKCAQEVIPLGNPLIWWLGAAALLALITLIARQLHTAALPILTAFFAGWVPWLMYYQRTTFTFYSVVFIPYTVMALALLIHIVSKRFRSRPDDDEWDWLTIGFLCLVAVITMFFYPILTGIAIPYEQWHLRMWLPSWV